MFIKEKQIKKLLAILISVAGLNSYVEGLDMTLSMTNSTAWYLAAKCFPSGNLMNGIGDTDSFSCSDTDTVMYFGRTSMSSSTTTDELDTIKVFTLDDNATYSNYHSMGDGHVWLITLGTRLRTNSFQVEGDPTYTIDCLFNS